MSGSGLTIRHVERFFPEFTRDQTFALLTGIKRVAKRRGRIAAAKALKEAAIVIETTVEVPEWLAADKGLI